MGWLFRYASHLSYRVPDQPLFLHSVGTLDPVSHVEYAADLGFSGIRYAYAVNRPESELDAVAKACLRLKMEIGCILYAPHEMIRRPLWGLGDQSAREEIDKRLELAFAVAARLGSRHLAILSGADSTIPIDVQRRALVENLKRAAERAESAGIFLELAPVSSQALPSMLLHHISDAVDVLSRVGSRAARLIFDTAHIYGSDGDPTPLLDSAWPWIEVVQLADHPNRIEPGAGAVAMEPFLTELHRRKFTRLVELEHRSLWSAGIAERTRRVVMSP